ncbi:hypothetical protein Trydic_g13556 [Trypoxylus dichotomus]
MSFERVNTINSRQNKCYNCNEVGHKSVDCKKPRRERGSCYSSGSSEHPIRDCSRGGTREQGSTSRMDVPKADRSTNLVEEELENSPAADVAPLSILGYRIEATLATEAESRE